MRKTKRQKRNIPLRGRITRFKSGSSILKLNRPCMSVNDYEKVIRAIERENRMIKKFPNKKFSVPIGRRRRKKSFL